MPAIDAVLTKWPPSPCARKCGRKIATPCATVIRLTRMTHSQSGAVNSSSPALRPPTPALLKTRCTRPKARIASAAACSSELRSEASQTNPRRRSGGACELFDRPRQRALVEVGERDIRAFGQQRLGEGAPEPAGAAGYERRPAREIAHRQPSRRGQSTEPRAERQLGKPTGIAVCFRLADRRDRFPRRRDHGRFRRGRFVRRQAPEASGP